MPLDTIPPHWWRHPALLQRYVSDCINAELNQMRRSSAGLPAQPWAAGLQLERELGVDSLERYALASALSLRLHMQHSDLDQQLLQHTTLGAWVDCASASLDCFSAALSFQTSGSSGAPRYCEHALALLWQEIRYFSGVFGPVRRILYAVPAHHIYGFLFTVLLPVALPEAELVDARQRLPAEVCRGARPGDLIIGYPGFWASVAACGLPFPAGVSGVSSTAPCPAPLAQQLAAAGLRLLQVYGSSETAGVGWRDAAQQPYTLLPYWQRSAAVDVLTRPDAHGTPLDYAVPDVLEWRAERQFLPVARRDAAVQVGGINVYPEQVAALLRRHPGVSAAQVRLMRPDEGSRLKAFIVAAPGYSGPDLRESLLDWVRAELPAPARPVSFTLGPALPVGPQGKAADWIIDG
ncbi:MAG: hypothetical protein ACEQSK_14985 [Sphingomonadaceae bacterium]